MHESEVEVHPPAIHLSPELNPKSNTGIAWSVDDIARLRKLKGVDSGF
jgi:hypothetical protein